MTPSLFDWADRARVSDPDTSKNAAVSFNVTERRRQFFDGLRSLGTATANEVALFVCGDNRRMHESIRRRASDLVKMGLIEIAGRRECDMIGKRVTVYRVSNGEQATKLHK